MLGPEEKVIMYWLSQYGVMLQEQAIGALTDKGRTTASAIIRGLMKQRRLCYLHGGYYVAAGPKMKPDDKIIAAIWVLLQYIYQIDPMNHHRAQYPGQIYFLRNGCGYEIVVLGEGDYLLPTMLTPQADLKFIIVVPDEEMIPDVKLPNAPCMFATVTYDGERKPTVRFIRPEGG